MTDFPFLTFLIHTFSPLNLHRPRYKYEHVLVDTSIYIKDRTEHEISGSPENIGEGKTTRRRDTAE